MALNPTNISLSKDFRQLSTVQKNAVRRGGALVGLALFTPLAVLALTTVTTVAMAAVVRLALFMGFSALPLILRWWRIRIFKMMKATARRNPVETLQLELIDRRQAFEAAGATVVAVSAMRIRRARSSTNTSKNTERRTPVLRDPSISYRSWWIGSGRRFDRLGSRLKSSNVSLHDRLTAGSSRRRPASWQLC